MSPRALGAIGNVCFFLIAINNFWTTALADRVRTKSHASSVSLDNNDTVLLLARKGPPRENSALKRNLNQIHWAMRPNAWTRDEPPGGPTTITADDVVEASPHAKPEMRQRWWRRILPGKKPKSTKFEEYDESKLMRVPTFMRSDKTFREKLIRLFDKINERFRRKQVMRDLYRRHAEDERIYGGNNDDDM